MNYALIGSGNMAWYLADSLTRAGHTCSGLWARNPLQAQELASAYNLGVFRNLSDLLNGMDCCIIAVPDHAVAGIAAQLSLHTTVLLHTAGSLPVSALQSYATNCGVIWPVFSITRSSLPLQRSFSVAYEGNTQAAVAVARSLAGSLSVAPVQLALAQRQWLHLAAVVGNNYTNHLLELAMEICREQSISITALMPIIRQTFDRLEQGGASGLRQTGPAMRRDVATIQLHEEMLAASPAALQLYQAITASIQARHPRLP